MRHRIRVLLAMLALTMAGTVVHAGVAQADPEPVQVSTASSSGHDDWACVAVDGAEVGTCLENPFKELSGRGGVVGIAKKLIP